MDDYELWLKKSEKEIKTNYQLPDGKMISLGDELFKAPEILFQPDLVGLAKDHSAQKLIYTSVMKLDHDRRDMYTNMILCGGSALFGGFMDRLKGEMRKVGISNMQYNGVVADGYSAWKGGCILASLETFTQMWIVKEEYDESGVGNIHRKCF